MAYSEMDSMGRCGTHEVELLDGRNIQVDPVTAERLNRFIISVPEGSLEEAQKLCITINETKDGWLQVPTAYWKDRFGRSLDGPLRACDLKIGVTTGVKPIYFLRYVQERTRRAA
ncbi:MAG: hypothetical protein AAGF20_00180 [Pseudomonadota bacterium]